MTDELTELVDELTLKMQIAERTADDALRLDDPEMHLEAGRRFHELADQIQAITGKDPRSEG